MPKAKKGSKKPPTGDKVTWKSKLAPKEEEPESSSQQLGIILGGIFILFLFVLYFFVDDRPETEIQRQQTAVNNTKSERKQFEFEASNLFNSTQLIQMFELQKKEDSEFDRILLIAFENSAREANGDPTKVKLFKKWESIAKTLPRKKLFKRYEEDELPMLINFDCGNPNDPTAENICKQIIGDRIPNAVIFRPGQQPKTLPEEHRSDNQIAAYLYDMMQPPVRYLEELAGVEEFTADDSEMKVVLFGNDKSGAYTEVADYLREFGKFGRTTAETAANQYDVEMPQILMWRTFGENPITFNGNMSNPQEIHQWTMNNYLPLFGEFSPTLYRRYMRRQLPMFWLAINSSEDRSLEPVFEEIREIAQEFQGQFSFLFLDVRQYPEMGKNLGLEPRKVEEDEDEEDRDASDEEEDEEPKPKKKDKEILEFDGLPTMLVRNQFAELSENIEMESINESIMKVVNEYIAIVSSARQQSGQQPGAETQPIPEMDEDDEIDEEESEDMREDDEPELEEQDSKPEL